MNSLEWTKKHQKEIVDKIIADAGLEPSEHPDATFMAGLPGAGKTELSMGLVKEMFSGSIRIDMDELATKIEGYTPERADEFRESATRLLNVLFDKVIKSKLNFVMDGTFSSDKSLQNVGRVLKRGYNVSVVFSCQDPRVAWSFTKARELVEHRAIKEEGFLESYYKMFKNLRSLKEYYPEATLNVIVKNESNRIKRLHFHIEGDSIDDIANFIYNKDKLKEYIEGNT